MDFEIRSEDAAEANDIFEVTQAAFAGAEHSSGTEGFVVNALRERAMLTVSLVGMVEGQLVGHIALSPVRLSDGTLGWYGLGPLSVLPRYQRVGIGRALVEEALKRLRDLGASGCVVLGDPFYYSRFGFRVREALVYPGVPSEYFQAMSFDGVFPSGEVAYDVAFEATDSTSL